jgi:glycosyltransferase involved in cell wall biosynthesis
MKLVASLLVHNEIDRYLALCVEALLEYVDEIRAVDDASTDGSFELLAGAGGRVNVAQLSSPQFFQHEGKTRQALLEWTMKADPTHVLAIDADEFVAEPDRLLDAIRRHPAAPAFTLCMEEVWQADEAGYRVRCDGGWCPHEVPSCYTVPDVTRRGASWAIQDRALACGREPMAIRETSRSRGRVYTDTALLHFGWTRVAEREARHERYAIADGGKFHASQHLDSILWPPERVLLEPRSRPGFGIYAELADAANREPAAPVG